MLPPKKHFCLLFFIISKIKEDVVPFPLLPEIPIILKANSTEISEIIGTKLCALKVNYINPFTDEEITKILNLTITVS